MSTPQTIKPIAAGYAYSVRLQVDGGDAAFPADGTYRADVRALPYHPDVAGILSTVDGSLVRIDDFTLDLHLSATTTALIGAGTAYLDIVRTDGAGADWLGIEVEIPSIRPVTRSGV